MMACYCRVSTRRQKADSQKADIFRWLTAREQPLMLLSQPAFRSPQAMLRPPNVEKAEVAGPGMLIALALAAGCRKKEPTPEPAAAAAPLGASVLTARPQALDLAERGADRRLPAWLHDNALRLR